MSAEQIAAYRRAEQRLANSQLQGDQATLMDYRGTAAAGIIAERDAAQADRDRLYELVKDELAHNALVAEYERLLRGALGPEREVVPDRYIEALCTSDAELHGEAATLFDLCMTSGPHGDGPEGIRVRRDAARILYARGDWVLLERLSEHDPEVRSLLYFEIQHCGRPKTDGHLFAGYLPNGEQFAPPPLADAPKEA